MVDRILKQMDFLAEIEKFKLILRKNIIIDKSRNEDDAGHSWSISVMAIILYEYADHLLVDLSRTIKMLLVHDLVEIYAGDTFAYDKQANQGKEAREGEAALRLFGLLPEDQNSELRNLWIEFEQMKTPDAQFANAIDRLQPFLLNYLTDGYTWVQGDVKKSQIIDRMSIVKQILPDLWFIVEDIIEKSLAKKYIS
jgi:putative hydrolase of HD superfamily